MRCDLYNFLILEPQLNYTIRYTVTCDAMRLYHVIGNFGMIFAIFTAW